MFCQKSSNQILRPFPLASRSVIPVTFLSELIMPNENNELPLDVEAQLEEAESEATQKAILKRGLASLRGTRRSVNMRRSILRMLSKSPEEIAAYSPANGFELLAKNLCVGSEKERDVAVRVWREVKETLGERIGSRWKDTVEERERKHAPDIIVDIPMPTGNLSN
jgi:hypothetical protein